MTNYHGSCQCGAIEFDVELESLDGSVTCNCSRCKRLGSVLVFAPQSAFTLNKGEGALSEYLFNNRTIQHKFCKTCGIQPFGYGAMPDGSPTVAVNVNCLDGIDPRSLTSHHYDGASI